MRPPRRHKYESRLLTRDPRLAQPRLWPPRMRRIFSGREVFQSGDPAIADCGSALPRSRRSACEATRCAKSLRYSPLSFKARPPVSSHPGRIKANHRSYSSVSMTRSCARAREWTTSSFDTRSTSTSTSNASVANDHTTRAQNARAEHPRCAGTRFLLSRATVSKQAEWRRCGEWALTCTNSARSEGVEPPTF
ncbi:MAG: hypothetical protein QOE62_1290 [Actinomycetota bacterium]|nr:hypothetical protein [Actinomycetota bacterium]